MESTIPNTTFCPDIIFNRLDTYITQVQILDNQQVSNPKKITSRTLGSIFLSETVGIKKIEIVKDEIAIYSATKTDDWKIIENQLNCQQIVAIESLPQTKNEIFLEYYGRKLTLKLKEVFQEINYPIDRVISLNHSQIAYNFIISPESTSENIVFTGANVDNEIVFQSSFNRDTQVKVIINNFSLEQLNQLCCHDF